MVISVPSSYLIAMPTLHGLPKLNAARCDAICPAMFQMQMRPHIAASSLPPDGEE
jgi:hypothetical protein